MNDKNIFYHKEKDLYFTVEPDKEFYKENPGPFYAVIVTALKYDSDERNMQLYNGTNNIANRIDVLHTESLAAMDGDVVDEDMIIACNYPAIVGKMTSFDFDELEYLDTEEGYLQIIEDHFEKNKGLLEFETETDYMKNYLPLIVFEEREGIKHLVVDNKYDINLSTGSVYSHLVGKDIPLLPTYVFEIRRKAMEDQPTLEGFIKENSHLVDNNFYTRDDIVVQLHTLIDELASGKLVSNKIEDLVDILESHPECEHFYINGNAIIMPLYTLDDAYAIFPDKVPNKEPSLADQIASASLEKQEPIDNNSKVKEQEL